MARKRYSSGTYHDYSEEGFYRSRRYPQTRQSGGCCGCAFVPLLLVIALLWAYLLPPFGTSVLVLGIDEAPPDTFLGRTDTIMMIKANPLPPKLTMLSIPRDLWVVHSPGVENRINTIHFFAEGAQPGSGAVVAKDTINQLFGTRINYYLRFSFNSVIAIVDSIGGIDVTVENYEGGLSPGTHHLDGLQTLDFVRERKSADDFSRMRHGQLAVSAFMKKVLSPAMIPQYPALFRTVYESIDTNIPIWHMPRLAFIFTAGFFMDSESVTIDRTMVTPFTTSGGAAVLLPDWNQILPFVQKTLNR